MQDDHKQANTNYVRQLVEDKCDPKLGAAVKAELQKLGLEPIIDDSRALAPSYHPKQAHSALEQGIHNAFSSLGLDVQNDPSIQDTPRRYATMFVGELTKGLNYDFFPKCTATPNGQTSTTRNLFEAPKEVRVGAYDQMVLVEKIQTTSLCEHHLQTIDGHTAIAYIPRDKVLGLSKFARVTEFFAARPQIQERLTEQVYAALSFILDTEDVAVSIDAVHFCMRARGARQPHSSTVTNKMGGRFLTNASLREEFFAEVRG